MSWDVFIQNLPSDARSVHEIPDDFRPPPLGSHDEVTGRIIQRFPDLEFTGPSWGRLQRDGFSIDISLGEDGNRVIGVTLHVRGSDDAVQAVIALIDTVGGGAVDSWTGEFFDQATALQSIRRWRAYMEEI